YSLPFHGNKLVEGWQVSGILSVNTGLPVTVQDGQQIAGLFGIQGDRPDYSGTCPGGKDHVLGNWYEWFAPTCYKPQPIGVLGLTRRGSVKGPGYLGLDTSVIKQTKVTERLNAEFRAEFFNILNHTNLGQPSSYTLLGVCSKPATVGC